mmetsp:Transcript_7357/g.17170  ORF Transcript_7357/g.17170 Transcript_7357/m.17170 type:complete len:225 (-) Transcript_7357:178-852(-)
MTSRSPAHSASSRRPPPRRARRGGESGSTRSFTTTCTSCSAAAPSPCRRRRTSWTRCCGASWSPPHLSASRSRSSRAAAARPKCARNSTASRGNPPSPIASKRVHGRHSGSRCGTAASTSPRGCRARLTRASPPSSARRWAARAARLRARSGSRSSLDAPACTTCWAPATRRTSYSPPSITSRAPLRACWDGRCSRRRPRERRCGRAAHYTGSCADARATLSWC